MGCRRPVRGPRHRAVREERLAEPQQDQDARRAPVADTYLAGRDGASYMDLAQFAAVGITVETQHYEHPVYTQEHGEFVPFLSALDLLLIHGDEALGILCEGSTWSRLSPEPN